MGIKNGWLQEILTGVEISEDQDKAIASHLGQNFVSKSDFNTKLTELETANTRAATRETQLKSLAKLVNSDPEKLSETIEGILTTNKDTDKEYQKKLAEAKLDFAVDAGLAQLGAKNPTVVRPLLDMSLLKLGEDGKTVLGLDSQVTSIQKDNEYLFNDKEADKSHMQTQFTPIGPDGNGEPGKDDVEGYMNQMIRGAVGQGDDE